MVKLDISLETIENGILVTIDDKKFICRNYNELGRRLISHLDRGKNNKSKSLIQKEFMKDKVGKIQTMILKEINNEGFATVKKITEKLSEILVDDDIWNIRGRVRMSFNNLARRGFIKRHNANSHKYIMVKQKKVTE